METCSTNMSNKKILFAYHRLDVIGGIETRWIDEFKYLKKNNYHITLLAPSEKINPGIAKLLSIDNLVPVYVNDLDSANNFISLVNCIIDTIRTQNIDVISVHMFNKFVFASIIAAQICKIPIISTVHGTPDIYKKPIERIIYQHFSDKSIGLSVTVSRHLDAILKTQSPQACIIPNLINLEKYKAQTINEIDAWLIVSRLSPEKFPSILRFLKSASSCGIKHIHLAGGGNQNTIHKIETLIKSLNLKIEIKCLGEVEDIASLIPKYRGIAGLGRVALEGLASRKPVCILTPDGNLIGLVTTDNFRYLKDYNFMGKTLNPIDETEFKRQLESHTSTDSEDIYQLLSSTLSTENWPKFIEKYNRVEFVPNAALEAFYHKLDYFANAMSAPFFNDPLFIHLLKETVIEYNLGDINHLLDFYNNSYGLQKKYPSPIKMKSRMSLKQRFLNIF